MIKFPKLHIATSVVNRILNARDELERGKPTPEPPSSTTISMQPNVPDATLQGAGIDLATQQPIPDVGEAAMDGSNSPAANTFEAAISGGKPIQGLLDGISVG